MATVGGYTRCPATVASSHVRARARWSSSSPTHHHPRRSTSSHPGAAQAWAKGRASAQDGRGSASCELLDVGQRDSEELSVGLAV